MRTIASQLLALYSLSIYILQLGLENDLHDRWTRDLESMLVYKDLDMSFSYQKSDFFNIEFSKVTDIMGHFFFWSVTFTTLQNTTGEKKICPTSFKITKRTQLMKIVTKMTEILNHAIFQNISHSFDFEWLLHFKLAN